MITKGLHLNISLKTSKFVIVTLMVEITMLVGGERSGGDSNYDVVGEERH